MKKRTTVKSYPLRSTMARSSSYSYTETASRTRRRSLNVCCQMFPSVQAQGIINSRTRANIKPL